MTFLNKFLQIINEHEIIDVGDKILIGLSAGPDSICLFHLLESISQKYLLELAIAHINYQLRGDESKREALWIQDLSKKKKIPLYQKTVTLKNKSNLQAECRSIRFDFFKKVIEEENYNKLFLGHHLDDQIETFFMRLIRGSSLSGLRAMDLISDFDSITIIRPLLNCRKAEIMDYLNINKLHYFTDSTNLTSNYLRNSIRLTLLPELEKIQPDYRQRIANTISHVKEADNILIQETLNAMKDLSIKKFKHEVHLDKKKFNDMPEELRKRVLIHLSREVGKHWNYLNSNQLCTILSQLENDLHQGHKILFQKEDLTVLSEYESLVMSSNELKTNKYKTILQAGQKYILTHSITKDRWELIVSEKRQNKESLTAVLKQIKTQTNPFILYLDKEKIKGHLSYRSFILGDRLYLGTHLGYKKIKELFIDKKIPKRLRKEVLIFCDEEQAVAVLSLPPYYYCRISNNYHVHNDSSQLIQLEIQKLNKNLRFQDS